MKKEQETEMLNGMVQVIALLNLYSDISKEMSGDALKAKSERNKNKKLDNLVLSQMAFNTIMTVINVLGPFLVSLGLNFTLNEETGEYSVVYKGNLVEITEEGKEMFYNSLLKEAENL